VPCELAVGGGGSAWNCLIRLRSSIFLWGLSDLLGGNRR
jgi:hypothetical protein